MDNKPHDNTMDDVDILLIITPPFFTKMPSVGVAYLSTYLKYKGYRPLVLDLSLKLHNKAPGELRKFWQMDCTNSCFVTEISDTLFTVFHDDITDLVDFILSRNIKVIGFSVNIVSIFLANKIAKLIKSKDPSRIIIFGGPGTYCKHPRELIEPGFVDFYIRGEGEEALRSVLDHIIRQRDFADDNGLTIEKYLESSIVTSTVQIADLNSVPFPTYSEFNLRAYNQGIDYKPLPLLTSRGCIRSCTYCIDHVMWPKFRFRSAVNVMEEIRFHMVHNKVRNFEFNDLVCNGNLRQLSELCDAIIASGLKFNWASYAIVRKDMGPELFSKMKESGCSMLIYGVENGSNEILKKMGKPYTAHEASEVIRRTHEAGIYTNINIILGFPGETEDDFTQTIEFINANKDSIDEVTNISACTVFPDAEIGRNKEKFGVYLEDNTDPMLFCDQNGLNRQGRNQRVERLVKIVSDLGLAKAIINKPSLNPEVKLYINKHKKRKKLKAGIMIFGVLLFTIFVEVYHSLLKRLRGWTLFPGG